MFWGCNTLVGWYLTASQSIGTFQFVSQHITSTEYDPLSYHYQVVSSSETWCSKVNSQCNHMIKSVVRLNYITGMIFDSLPEHWHLSVCITSQTFDWIWFFVCHYQVVSSSETRCSKVNCCEASIHHCYDIWHPPWRLALSSLYHHTSLQLNMIHFHTIIMCSLDNWKTNRLAKWILSAITTWLNLNLLWGCNTLVIIELPSKSLLCLLYNFDHHKENFNWIWCSYSYVSFLTNHLFEDYPIQHLSHKHTQYW